MLGYAQGLSVFAAPRCMNPAGSMRTGQSRKAKRNSRWLHSASMLSASDPPACYHAPYQRDAEVIGVK